MRDHWCLAIRTERPEHVRALLSDAPPLAIEALP
jgi:hypothetical protein